jgi:glycosyltransferase involved in cell wall biosynthesis
MRVLVNGVASLRPKTGIGHYIDSLHGQLVSIAGDERISLYPSPFMGRLLKRLFRAPPPRRTEGGPSASARKSMRPSWLSAPALLARRVGSRAFRAMFRRYATRQAFNLYHEPNYIPWECDLPVVSTIHDLSVFRYPEWHPSERVKHFEAHFRQGLRRCSHLIADSRAVRNEIVDILGVAPERVTAVHLGVRPIFEPMSIDESLPALQRLGLKPGYLLHVGTIEPRKNLLLLMQAYCDLPAPLRERCPLVLIGGWGWRNESIRDYFETTARHLGVVHFGYAPESDLPSIYNGARALVFPSHYEGFGLPPLEMMACGGAVIASSASSLREIMPKRSRLIPPDDVAAWRDAIKIMIAEDDFWSQSRIGSVQHASRFTWEQCARDTWNVYEQVLGVKMAIAA